MNGEIISHAPYPSPNPNVLLSSVIYLSQGLKIKGLLAEPKEPGEYDGFLYLRGGMKNVGRVRPSQITFYAQEGFIVFAPFYRGNQGGEGDEDFGLDDRADAFSGFQLLLNHPRVKNGRVHVFGFSRGGLMALWTGIQYQPTSIVTWGGITDMFLLYEERIDLRRTLKRIFGGTPWRHPEAYRRRTPLYSIEKLESPLLIIHGEKDKHVSIEHAYRLEKMGERYEKQIEKWFFPGLNHYFPPKEKQKTTIELSKWMKNQ